MVPCNDILYNNGKLLITSVIVRAGENSILEFDGRRPQMTETLNSLFVFREENLSILGCVWYEGEHAIFFNFLMLIFLKFKKNDRS